MAGVRGILNAPLKTPNLVTLDAVHIKSANLQAVHQKRFGPFPRSD
jgi:hypothetical protein